MTSGIYQIMNKQNFHIYVGSTYNFEKRWRDHKYYLRKGMHSNRHLQNAWNKYGEDSFDFSVVEYVDGGKEAWINREQYYTDLWNPEYSIAKECVTSSLGIKRSEETKQKISASLMGKKYPFRGSISEEHKRKIRKTMFGVKHSEQRKINISRAHIGIKPSEETLRKRSISMMGKNMGKLHSEETKRKISEASKGKKHSEERRKNHSEATKKWWTERKNEVL